ncbi:MAG: GGDEF domain-containing protein [Thermodesulfovibrionaceae bacterium]
MKISDILKQYPEVINLYLENLSNSGWLIINKKRQIVDCNKGFLELLGIQKKPIKLNIKTFLSKSSEELIFPEKSFAKLNLLFIGNNNVEILLKGFIFALKDHYLMIFEQHRLTYNELIVKMSKLNDEIVNLTRKLEKKNAQLKEDINTVKNIMNKDPLTGILNRRGFEKMLKKQISFALRHKLPLSVVMIDIDYFKKINDTYGHETGDKVLKIFAKTLEKSIRQEDIVGRFGGEEFVIAFPNTKIEQALSAAERIRQKIEKMKIKAINGNITASFGITELLLADDEERILKRADEALYEAKRGGRNRCEIK